MLPIGVIGMGGRISGMLSLLVKNYPEVQVAVVADPNEVSARRNMERRKLDASMTTFVPDVETLLRRADGLKGLMIGTRCHLHTDMAVAVAPLKLPLFLEKPVAINAEQLARLRVAYAGREDQVVVSFPLRLTPLFTASMEIVRAGRLGTISQVQAINNVTYGGVYFGNWYRNYDQTGGLWLQKATHDFDYLNQIMAEAPVSIAATSSRAIYGGDMPHDLRCSACDKVETCSESHRNHKRRGDNAGMAQDPETWDHDCCFSRDIRNQDAGSALIRYASGVHVCYSQNFISRRKAGTRGAVITGHRGTLSFDWYTDRIRVVDHFEDRVDQIDVKPSGGHGGGDGVLVDSYVDLLLGRAPSRSDLKAGLLSVAMCLAAKRSCASQRFEPVQDPQAGALTPELALVEN